jgi:protein-arginine kinase activator protein McsA
VKDREKSLHKLQAELAKAVGNEEFEQAAALRDKIREMEKKHS